MKLRAKLLTVWGSLTLLLWAGTLWPVRRAMDDSFRRLSKQSFDGARAGLAAIQAERVNQMRQASAMVMSIPELRALIAEHDYELSAANRASLRERIDAMAKLMGVDFVAVLDVRGAVVAQTDSSPWPTLTALGNHLSSSPQASALVRRTFSGSTASYGLWSVGGRVYQVVGTPLIFGGDDPAAGTDADGAILIATAITDPLAAELAGSQHCQLTVLSADGAVAATSFSRPIGPSTLGDGGEVSIGGHAYLSSTESLVDPCSGAPVGRMLVHADQAEARAARDGVGRTLLAILGTGLAVVGFASYAVSGAITKPIGRLVADVRRVGGGDLHTPLTTAAGRDEVSELTRAFSDMVQQVRRRLELERQVEESKAAVTAKAALMATMSHEVRTPLNGVIGMSDLLLTGEGLTDRQRRYAGLIKASAESLTKLINDALDLSKAEAGKMELESVDFDLAGVVEDVAELFAARAADKGVAIIADVNGTMRRAVNGDPGRLRQVLTNLLNNAVKFTATGHVIVRCAAEGELVRFEVIDTGPGIGPETIGRLFKSFSQADATTARQFGGTGLGLAICKQLAELMGGRVGVNSTIGQGSTFWFTARFRPAATLVVAPVSFASTAAIVDLTDSVTAGVLTARLREWGLTVVTTPSGDAAIQSQTSDLRLPVSDTIRFVSGLPGSAERRTIAVVGIATDVTAEELQRRGLAAVVTTPLRLDRLAESIAAAVAGKHAAVIAENATAVPQRSGRILVADDQEVNRLVVTEMLAGAGLRCDTVVDGRAAVAAVVSATVPYDLVLMDCQMPELDGYAATRAIRADEAAHRRRSVPIIALTGRSTAEDARAAVDAGMNGHCPKPIDRAMLLAVVEPMIESDRPSTDDALQIRLGVREQPSVSRGGAIGDPPHHQTDPIDLSKALSRCGNKPSLASKVLAQFITQAEAAMKTITTATDPSDVTRAAHGLKGSAGMISADAVFAAAGEVESAADGAAPASIARLRAEVERAAEFVRRSIPVLTASSPARTEAA